MKIAIILFSLVLSGCALTTERGVEMENETRSPFEIADIARSDINLVMEMTQREVMEYLEQIMLKLYRRNPRVWKASTNASSPEASVRRVFSANPSLVFPEMKGHSGVKAIQLAFKPSFQGDRVLALMIGLRSMILASYNHKMSFHMLDSLDPQKLYNSARNVEIAVWKLSSDRNPRGDLFLLSNGERNLSYERLFGKVIALQDHLARIVAQKTRRTIKHAIQFIASSAFFPI